MAARVNRLVLLLCLAVASTASGQAVEALPARVTLVQVLQLLDERSPRTVAERSSVGVAAADRITAATLPNPSVSYGGLRLLSGANTGAVMQHQVVVDQPLVLFGLRPLRREIADLAVTAEQGRIATVLADRRLTVRQAFASLLARQEELHILDGSQTELRRVAGIVRGRAEAGDRSQYDVLRIETEERLLEIEIMNAGTEVEDASGRLAALLGFPEWRPRAEGTLEAGGTTTEFAPLWESAQMRRPALIASRRRQSLAQGGVRLAQRERLPVPVLSGGTLVTRGEDSTSAFFGVSIPVPIFDRSRGPIARAAAQAQAEALAVSAEVAETQAEIERTRTTLASRMRTLAAVDRDLMPNLPGLRRMAEDAYREGRGDMLELLDVSRSLRAVQRLRIQQLELTKLAEEDVIAAAGLDASPVPR